MYFLQPLKLRSIFITFMHPVINAQCMACQSWITSQLNALHGPCRLKKSFKPDNKSQIFALLNIQGTSLCRYCHDYYKDQIGGVAKIVMRL